MQQQPSSTPGENELPDHLARHRAFWQRAPVDRPLVCALDQRVWQAKPYPLSNGRSARDSQRITVDDLDIDLLLGRDKPPPALLSGDLINPLNCTYPAAWMEAVAGCPIYASAYGCVARPVTADVDEALRMFSLEDALRSPWLDFMDALMDRAGIYSAGRFPVSQLHQRGVIDILAAYLGEEPLCMAVYDAPDQLAALADQMADLFIAVAERGFHHRPLWQDGSVSCWQLYAPGRLVDYQIDASSLFSPDVYARYFARFDRKVLHAFPHTLIHLHSVGLHLVDAVLDTEAAQTIEINFDREAGHWDPAGMLAVCRKIQARGRSLLLVGELSDAEYQEFVGALDPAGLAILHWRRGVTVPLKTKGTA